MAAGKSQFDGAYANAGKAVVPRVLARVLRNTGVSVFYQNASLETIWVENTPAGWTGPTGDLAGLPPEMIQRIDAARVSVLRSGTPARLEVSLLRGETPVYFDIWIDADRDEQNEICGLITTAVETTDHKRREQTLRALLREVSHRSKNLLAIIQSIASQTGRYSATIDGFLARFRGRIQSLASSQDLVTSSNWRGADLKELVIGQLSRYVPSPQGIRFEGERVWLNPNAALHVGLALHELAVNSVTYGALTDGDGFVTVRLEPVVGDTNANALALIWTEIVPPNIEDRWGSAPKRFGSIALETVVPASLNGTAKLTVKPERLEYQLVIPRGNFAADS